MNYCSCEHDENQDQEKPTGGLEVVPIEILGPFIDDAGGKLPEPQKKNEKVQPKELEGQQQEVAHRIAWKLRWAGYLVRHLLLIFLLSLAPLAGDSTCDLAAEHAGKDYNTKMSCRASRPGSQPRQLMVAFWPPGSKRFDGQ